MCHQDLKTLKPGAAQILLAKHDIDPREEHLYLGMGNLTHALREKTPIKGYNLRDVRHGVFRESCKPG